MEHQNLDTFLTDDVLLCQIGDPKELEAIIAIDQSDIAFVKEDQQVELFLSQLPGQRIASTINQVSKENIEISPRRLSGKAGGDLETTTDSTGRERPLNTTYPASARIYDDQDIILIGTRGTAKINAGYQTIARRLWRYLSKTFNFDL